MERISCILKFSWLLIDGQGEITTKDLIHLERKTNQSNAVGLSLLESKQLLKSLQQKMVLSQVEDLANAQKYCACCLHKRRTKSYHTIQYRTLFGIIPLQAYVCIIALVIMHQTKHSALELHYLETKWASLMSYELTAKLLQDVLPVNPTQNATTVRNHLHKIAQRQEDELIGKPDCISGCPIDWRTLTKPNKPITVGIDIGWC